MSNKKKIWSAGDQITASDINSNFIGGFGGTGADGALSISSGTTTVSLGSAPVKVLNYSSISITGTGKLAFSNPHNNGTLIILKSQGDVTLTSSTVPCIDASGMGGQGGAAGSGSGGSQGSDGYSANTIFLIDGNSHAGVHGNNAGGAGGTIIPNPNYYTTSQYQLYRKGIFLVPGSGGAGGNSGGSTNPGGAGGAGGAALYIECGGALNFTGTISVNGINGTNGTGNASSSSGGGGGGGSAGMCAILYGTLTANSGTITSAGGSGGNGGSNGSGAGSVDTSGGGGAGSLYGAGGHGASYNSGNGQTAAGGNGAGGGGGNGYNANGGSATGTSGGSSSGGLVAQNTEIF